MNCNVAKFNQCRLIQESFTSPLVDFGDLDISSDSFIYSTVRHGNNAKKQHNTIINSDNTVIIEPFNLGLGTYYHELIWTRGGVSRVIFQGRLIITDGHTSNCTTCNEVLEIIIDQGDDVINVSISETIVNNLIWSGSVLHFEVNENMELVMYETIPTPLDFNLTNGYLTINT